MLSEGGPLVAALLVVILGGFIAVQPWLIGAAIVFTVVGVLSLPGARQRGQPETAEAPQPASE
jgi:hypothetical protein